MGGPRFDVTSFSRGDDITELQKAACDGDQQAWRALVEHYSPLVWSVGRAYRLNLADSQDVYQYVWLTLTQHLGAIKEPAALGAWLYTVAKNECLRTIGRAVRSIPTDCVIEADPGNNDSYADAFILLEDRNAELWRAVDQLPQQCSSLLRAWASDPPPTYDQIATALGIPIGTIGPTRQRCLERLRRRLALIRIRQDWDDL